MQKAEIAVLNAAIKKYFGSSAKRAVSEYVEAVVQGGQSLNAAPKLSKLPDPQIVQMTAGSNLLVSSVVASTPKPRSAVLPFPAFHTPTPSAPQPFMFAMLAPSSRLSARP